MRTLFFVFAFLAIHLSGSAQDTLRKKDGTVQLIQVKEISDDMIVYMLFAQPDGPIRKVFISAVAEIAYADGTVERFSDVTIKPTPARTEHGDKPESYEPGAVNNTGHTVVIPRNGRDLKIRPGERFPAADGGDATHLAKGKYLEGMMGYGYSSKIPEQSIIFSGQPDEVVFARNITLGARFGSRYYLGNHEKYAFGLHVAWFTITGMVNDKSGGDIVLAPVNIGLSAAFLVDVQSSIEINTTTGYAASTLYRNTSGLNYGLAVKFRYQRLFIGLDFSRTSAIFGNKSEFGNIYSFTLGAKL
jgi:hypothetical protein